MNCRDVSEMSALYLSRELDANAQAEFQTHLETCPACAAELEHLAEMDARLHDAILSEPADTAAIELRVRTRIRQRSRHWAAIAVAAAAVFAIVGYGLVGSQITQERTCKAAARDHHVEVVEGQHRAWHSGVSEIGDLAERQGIPASAVAHLAPEGFQLERGKLCRVNGRVYVHLVYSNGSDQTSMFLRRQRPAPFSGIGTIDAGAEHAAFFSTSDVNAIVVSDRSREAAEKAAETARRVL